jgi:transposase-like protein
MAQRVGRKPLGTRHVDRLWGSARAKDRLQVFLETLRGTLTVVDACQLLELSESQFHQARHRWLQESLELLEPRRLGRPPHQPDAAEVIRERARLAAEVSSLREQLQAAQVREEITRIMTHPAGEPGEKTANRPQMRRRAR